MAAQVAAGDEGAHGVAEDHIGKTHIALLHHRAERVLVLDQVVGTAGRLVDAAPLGVGRRAPVAQLVDAADGVARIGQAPGHPLVAADVLHHTVHDLHDAARLDSHAVRALGQPQVADHRRGAVVRGKREVFVQHGATLSLQPSSEAEHLTKTNVVLGRGGSPQRLCGAEGQETLGGTEDCPSAQREFRRCRVFLGLRVRSMSWGLPPLPNTMCG